MYFSKSRRPSLQQKAIVCFTFAALLIAVLSEVAAAQPSEVTTGNIESLIGAEIPLPPPGYDSLPVVMAALQTGRETPINMNRTVRGVRVQRDVTYGMNEGVPVKLDLYQPRRGIKPKGGLVFVHGGGWRHGSKRDYNYYGQVFASKGYVLASIDYRLSGVAPFPAAVEDCHCAVRWMRANAKKLKIDPEKIIIAGGSAGGHLSLLTAYVNEEKSLHGSGGRADVSSLVAGVVSLYGPTDLANDFEQDAPAFRLVEDFIGKSFKAAPDSYHFASPITHLDKDDPPTLLLHGTIDNLVPVAQSDRLAEKLKELNVPHVYDRLPGWPHAMDISQRVNDRVVWMMDHFFQSVFAEKPEK